MSEIIFEHVTPGYDKREKIKEIYEEAFPERERGMPFEGLMAVSENSDFVSVLAAIEDGNVIGMITVVDRSEYTFLLYLAVNSEYRGRGLGSRIMTAIIKYFSSKPLLFSIEAPIEGSENYEQRVKRQAFYERLGCIKTNVIARHSNEIFIVYSSQKCEKVKEYMEDYLVTSENEKNKIMPSEEGPGNSDSKMTIEEI